MHVIFRFSFEYLINGARAKYKMYKDKKYDDVNKKKNRALQ